MSFTIPVVRRSRPAVNMPSPGIRTTRGPPPRRRLAEGEARAAEDSPAALPRGDRFLRARDQLERGVVGVPNGRAPGDRAMTLEHERRRVGMAAERVGHVAGDAEPRAP